MISATQALPSRATIGVLTSVEEKTGNFHHDFRDGTLQGTIEIQLGLEFRTDLLDQDRFAVAHVKSQPERNSMGSMVVFCAPPAEGMVISTMSCERTGSALIFTCWDFQSVDSHSQGLTDMVGREVALVGAGGAA